MIIEERSKKALAYKVSAARVQRFLVLGGAD
jgi:putative NADH-flavin reductase